MPTHNNSIHCNLCNTEIHNGWDYNRIYNSQGEEMLVCNHCLHERTFYCPCCNEYRLIEDDNILIEDETTGETTRLCHDCGTRYNNGEYFRCASCGNFIHRYAGRVFNGEHYCISCYRDAKKVIKDYHEVKDRTLTFFHTDTDIIAEADNTKRIYVGFELEIDNPDASNLDDLYGEELEEALEYRDDTATEVMSILGTQCVHCERDGSLRNGFEIISEPMTFNYLETVFKPKLKEAMDYLVERGYRSHDTNTCGLHFHISRSPFTGKQDIRIYKLFENNFKFFIDNFSRRKRTGYCQELPHLTPYNKHCIESRICPRIDRHSVVNFNNRTTIEFRMFKGTLNIDTFFIDLELVKWFSYYMKLTVNKRDEAYILNSMKRFSKVLKAFIKDKDIKAVVPVKTTTPTYADVVNVDSNYTIITGDDIAPNNELATFRGIGIVYPYTSPHIITNNMLRDILGSEGQIAVRYNTTPANAIWELQSSMTFADMYYLV